MKRKIRGGRSLARAWLITPAWCSQLWSRMTNKVFFILNFVIWFHTNFIQLKYKYYFKIYFIAHGRILFFEIHIFYYWQTCLVLQYCMNETDFSMSQHTRVNWKDSGVVKKTQYLSENFLFFFSTESPSQLDTLVLAFF